MPFISVRNLIVDFKRIDEDGNTVLATRAIDAANLDIEKGSFVAVVGMNGSGKSTLAKTLNGLIEPTDGEVIVDGMSTADESKLWDIRRKVAMVFQNPDNQIVSSIVEDDVAFGPENIGIEPAEIRKRVDEALKKVDMYDCKDKGAHMLSGGQKQRIAIAGAVAMRPECIVFDEPTAMLDPRGRQQVMDIIAELHASGITTILITHFMEEAAQAERILVMKDGKVLSDSTPDELFNNAELIEEAGLEVPTELALRQGTHLNVLLNEGGQSSFAGLGGPSPRQSSFAGLGGPSPRQSSFTGLGGPSPRQDAYTSEPAIEVKNLRYVYNPGMPGETAALDDMSFAIDQGTICGVIGHTGSGKSTMLQHLNGLLKPAEGEIIINGESITDGKAKLVDIRRKVGLVFQYPEYQLFEETVAKDVAFGPKNLGITGDELDETVKNAIEIVGLDYAKIKDASPFELSGGQKRRVAIAGVIAMKPQILILDEPTAGLDPKAHREVLAMVRNIHEEMGITIIFVSHNMRDIAAMSDKVLVINKGRIMMEGTPREVFARKDELESVGLTVPEVRRIMAELKKQHPEIDDNVLTIEEAAQELLAHGITGV